MHNVENSNFAGVRQGNVKRKNYMPRNTIIYTYEIDDASTSLELEEIRRTPTKNFVHIRSLCLPSFKSFYLIYEKKMK